MEGETIQDLDRQVEYIVKDKGIQLDVILKERGSAWDLDKIHKRQEFLKLLNVLFAAEVTTVQDLFLRNIAPQEINLYIWDYARIMRNLEFSVLFSLLCCLTKVNIISMKEGDFSMQEGMSPSEKLVIYMMLIIRGYSAEQYSYDTSRNIKKAAKKDRGITVSSYGKKWGGQLKYFDHTKENPHMADLETIRKVDRFMLRCIKRDGYSYRETVKLVGNKFGIKISPEYCTIVCRREKQNEKVS